MLQRILLDNTVFNYFGAIRSIDFYALTVAHLPTPFYISEAVYKEANKPLFYSKYPQLSIDLLEKIQPEGKIFRLCTTYDELLKLELSRVLDEGEAESIAQAQAIQSAIFVSDDSKAEKNFNQMLKSKNKPVVSEAFQFVSSFFLIALLEAQSQFLPGDFESAKKEFYQIRNFNQLSEKKKDLLLSSCFRELKLAYQLLGHQISDDELKRKCMAHQK